ECVHEVRRCRYERAGTKMERLFADQELGFSLEDVERVDVVGMGMRVRPFEAGLEFELDQRKLLASDLDRRAALVPRESLALAGREEDRVGRKRSCAWRSIDAVEPARFAAVPSAQVLGEALVRSVEVEKPGARGAAEAVDDLGRGADACVRREHL